MNGIKIRKEKFCQNEGPYIINEGEAEGMLLGGNLCTFNLLQEQNLARFKNAILF